LQIAYGFVVRELGTGLECALKWGNDYPELKASPGVLDFPTRLAENFIAPDSCESERCSAATHRDVSGAAGCSPAREGAGALRAHPVLLSQVPLLRFLQHHPPIATADGCVCGSAFARGGFVDHAKRQANAGHSHDFFWRRHAESAAAEFDAAIDRGARQPIRSAGRGGMDG